MTDAPTTTPRSEPQEFGADGAGGRGRRGAVRGPAAADAGREALAGLVERVTFHNPDNGFCVLRVKVRGQRTW